MSKPNPDQSPPKLPPDAAYIIPSHGYGKLIPARKGEVRNPTGHNGRYGEVVRLCQNASPEIAKRLIQIALDPNEDSRVSVVAAQEVFNRAFGKPKAEVKTTDTQPVTLDASKLTDRELEILHKLATTKQADE